MAQKDASSNWENVSPFNLIPEDFVTTAKQRMDDFATAQTELFGKCQNMNRHWVERFQVEAKVASELVAKLTAVRSIPEAMSAYQEWGSRRLEMMAEDAQQLLCDIQEFTQASLPKEAPGSAGVAVEV